MEKELCCQHAEPKRIRLGAPRQNPIFIRLYLRTWGKSCYIQKEEAVNRCPNILSTTYRVYNYRMCLLYALVCKGCAFHILFSYIIMKLRHETNCWSWFWVYNSNQKWKILKIRKKNFFFHFFWFLDSLQCVNQTKYLKLAHFLKIRNIKLLKNWKN